jgi:pentatricopeptide repeat protein
MQRSRLSAARCRIPVTSTAVMARRTLSVRGLSPRVSPSLFPPARFTRALSNWGDGDARFAVEDQQEEQQQQQEGNDEVEKPSRKGDELEQREIIMRLVDEKASPVGSYTPENWYEAEQCLSWWMQQRTAESVELTFQLLDRLIQERTIQARSETASSFVLNDSWLVDPTLLLRMLRNWRIVVLFRQNERPPVKFSVREMCDRLEGYVNSSFLCPDESCFFTVLSAASKLEYVSQRADICDYILQRTLQCHADAQPSEQEEADPVVASSFQPGTDFFNIVIRAWSESGRPEAPTRTRAIMEQMLEWRVKPDALTYQFVIYAWAAAGKPDEAEGLLRRMFSEYLEGDDRVRPELQTFTTVIFAWAKSGRPEAADRAEEILTAMREVGPKYKQEQGEYGVPLEADRPCMNAVLSCYAAAKNRAAAERAEEILRDMKENGPGVEIESYNMVVKAWASVGDAERAEALVDEAYQLYVQGNRHMRPNSDICTTVISAWVRSTEGVRVERAQAVMSKMREWNQLSSELNLRLGIASYNALLNVMANSTHRPKLGQKLPATQANELLKQMKAASREDASNVRPNRISYTTVINAWGKNGNVDEAQAVFRDMLSDYHEDGNESAKPDLRSFNSVLSSFAKTDKPGAPEEVCELLAHMHRVSDNDVSMQPDVYSYTSVLSCLARHVGRRIKAGKHIELAEEAERILADMQTRYKAGHENARPNTFVYNSVLNVLALSGLPERAEVLFQQMYQDYIDGNTGAKPGKDTFNTLIKAWAYSKHPESPQKCVEILERMEELEMSGVLSVFPNVASFTITMLCMTFQSRQKGMPQRADEILQRMDTLYKAGTIQEGPNKKSFQILKKGWMYSNEYKKKKRIAAIDQEMEKRFGPIQRPPAAKSQVR